MLFSKYVFIGDVVPGDLIRFNYMQPVEGDDGVRCGYVLSIRDTKKHPVENTSYRWYDHNFHRSRFLMTIVHGPKIKVFYQAACHTVRRYNILGRFFHKLGLIPSAL